MTEPTLPPIKAEWFRSGSTWWKSLQNRALLAAWVQARARKISVADCDAIAIAAITAFAERVLSWAAQNQGGVHNRDDTGEHVYLSTSCLHGEHDYCQAPLVDADRRKVPATCKFCSTPCVCECHRKEP